MELAGIRLHQPDMPRSAASRNGATSKLVGATPDRSRLASFRSASIEKSTARMSAPRWAINIVKRPSPHPNSNTRRPLNGSSIRKCEGISIALKSIERKLESSGTKFRLRYILCL